MWWGGLYVRSDLGAIRRGRVGDGAAGPGRLSLGTRLEADPVVLELARLVTVSPSIVRIRVRPELYAHLVRQWERFAGCVFPPNVTLRVCGVPVVLRR